MYLSVSLSSKYKILHRKSHQQPTVPSKQPCWKVFITALADGMQDFLTSKYEILFTSLHQMRLPLFISIAFLSCHFNMYFFKKKLDHSHQIISDPPKIQPGGKTCSIVEEHPFQVEKLLGLKLHAQ